MAQDRGLAASGFTRQDLQDSASRLASGDLDERPACLEGLGVVSANQNIGRACRVRCTSPASGRRADLNELIIGEVTAAVLVRIVIARGCICAQSGHGRAPFENPAQGAHSDAIMAELGYDAGAIAGLRREGAVG